MTLALVIVAFILLLLAAVSVPTGRVNLGWLGLAFYILSMLWGRF